MYFRESLKPMVRLSSNIHGNEAVGREMSLAFARWKLLVFVLVSVFVLHLYLYLYFCLFTDKRQWETGKFVGLWPDDHCLYCHIRSSNDLTRAI